MKNVRDLKYANKFYNLTSEIKEVLKVLKK